MDFQMTLEEKLEALKKLYEDETDDEMRRVILYQIKETEDLIHVRSELEKGTIN